MKSDTLGFGIKNILKESGIPLKIGIRNPSSTEKGSGLHYLESGIHGLESRIQNFSDSFTWGKVVDLSFTFFYSRQETIILVFREKENAGRALRAAVPAILLLSVRPKRISYEALKLPSEGVWVYWKRTSTLCVAKLATNEAWLTGD